MQFDLTTLSAVQVLIVALVLAVVDTGYAIVSAFANRTFSLGKVADFLTTHVLQRIFPIFALVAISASVTGPASTGLFALALAGLTAYLLETVGSISQTFHA